MKIYVAERGYNHQGFDIIGLYTTQEGAVIANEFDKDKGDYYDVEEFELKEINCANIKRLKKLMGEEIG